MEIRPFEARDEEAVSRCGKRSGLRRPWNDPRMDIARKRRVQRDLGRPKINLQVRKDNPEAVAFYERLGIVEDHAVSLGLPRSAMSPARAAACADTSKRAP